LNFEPQTMFFFRASGLSIEKNPVLTLRKSISASQLLSNLPVEFWANLSAQMPVKQRSQHVRTEKTSWYWYSLTIDTIIGPNRWSWPVLQ
jgi:hypothetical protein